MENYCIVCGKNNIDGIIIKKKKICICCEERIINCSNSDNIYNYYKNIIKKNIVPFIESSINNECQLNKGE